LIHRGLPLVSLELRRQFCFDIRTGKFFRQAMDKAFQIVKETNALLDETNRLKKQWYASKDSIESAKQMKITAQGYIDSMEATQKALSNCVIELFNMTRPPEVELAKIKGLVKTMGLDKLLDKAESK
jgi:hypothetical protein